MPRTPAGQRATHRPAPTALAAQAAEASLVRALATSQCVAVRESEATRPGVGDARLASSCSGEAGVSVGDAWWRVAPA